MKNKKIEKLDFESDRFDKSNKVKDRLFEMEIGIFELGAKINEIIDYLEAREDNQPTKCKRCNKRPATSSSGHCYLCLCEMLPLNTDPPEQEDEWEEIETIVVDYACEEIGFIDCMDRLKELLIPKSKIKGEINNAICDANHEGLVSPQTYLLNLLSALGLEEDA